MLIIVVALGLAMGAGGVESMSVTFEQKQDALVLTHEGGSLPVSLQAPALAFTNGRQMAPAAPAAVDGSVESAGGMVVRFHPADLGDGVSLEQELHLHWSPEEQILRKWARYRLNGAQEPWVLGEVTLDTFEAPGARLLGAEPQSYPAFLDGFFAGIEFPIAATRIEGAKVIVGHRPGVPMQPGLWYESRRAVYGPAPRGQEEPAFEAYIARHRPAPHELHVNYNSWWTSSVPFTEEEILGLMKQFEDNLYKPHGVALDTFSIDLGWSNDKSIWEISDERFPQGFANIQAAVERMDCHLGLWISPTAFYIQALDQQWAEDQGYETQIVHGWGGTDVRVCCLGGPKYAAAFRDRLVDMLTKYGIRHVKLDGYMLTCTEEDHGHQPGPLSAEAVAEGGVRAFQAMREAQPDVWLEATCFGWNPSPWWLFHVNSVIGTFGDDSPYGRVPAPVYWESKITARDYFNLQGTALLPIPVAAQEVLGLIVQTGDPFLNDGVTCVLRGHQFFPLYVNPRFMNPERWRMLAELLTWARNNRQILSTTGALLPVSWQGGKIPHFTNDEPMPREPYGYAHWKDGRGLIHLRNPWIEAATYALPLQTTEPADVVSLYPEARVYATHVQPGQTVEIPIAPTETLVLEVVPRPGMATNPLPGLSGPELSPVQAAPTRVDMTRVRYAAPDQLLGPDWTDVTPDSRSSASIHIHGKVHSSAPQTQLLVLLEGDKTPNAPTAALKVNGQETPLATGPSDAGWAASSIPAGEEHWLFLRADLPQGESDIELEVMPGGEVTHVSAWTWATKPGSGTPDYPNALPCPEIIPLGSHALLPRVETASIEQEEQREPVIERIDGIYLDALEPESVTQGWGQLQKNRAVTEKPLVIGGKRFHRGLGTHANARIVYALAVGYRTFEAWVGIDAGGSGTARFAVVVDGEKRWESDVLRAGQPAHHVQVDISGAKTLELLADDGGDGIVSDHADWGDAKLLR